MRNGSLHARPLQGVGQTSQRKAQHISEDMPRFFLLVFLVSAQNSLEICIHTYELLSNLGAMDLEEIFNEVNRDHFDGFLPHPMFRWNPRLRTSLGRFQSRPEILWFLGRPPMIEISTFLRDHPEREKWVRDTMGHEMIHYWLWLRGRPFGHTPEFKEKMKMMGVSRYNVLTKSQPKYVYYCPGCAGEYRTKRKLKGHACKKCCQIHSDGKYNSRFQLELLSELIS